MTLLVDQLSRDPHGGPHDEVQLERLMRQKERPVFDVPAFELVIVRRGGGGEALPLATEVLLGIAVLLCMNCGGLDKRSGVRGHHSGAEVQLVPSV